MRSSAARGPASNSEIHTVTWVNDDRLVYEYAEKVPGIDTPLGEPGSYSVLTVDGGRKKTLVRLPRRRQ